MKIEYDTEKLGRILRDFAAVSGLSLLVMDTERHPLVSTEPAPPPLCSKIHECPGGNDRCRASDKALLDACERCGKTVTHVCHAGLCDTVMPLYKGDVFAGFVFLGRMRTDTPKEEVASRLFDLGIDPADAEERYGKMPLYEAEKMRAVAELASFVLFSDAIRIHSSPLTESAVRYIDAHLTEDLRVGALCRALHTSKNVLYREFQSDFGKTVADVVNERRLDRAKVLLADTPMPISLIAGEVGIPSETYFSKLFRRLAGVTPTAFRKAAQAKKGDTTS